jgi:hypothetical protein
MQASIVDDDMLDLVSTCFGFVLVVCDFCMEQASTEEQREAAATAIIQGCLCLVSYADFFISSVCFFMNCISHAYPQIFAKRW